MSYADSIVDFVLDDCSCVLVNGGDFGDQIQSAIYALEDGEYLTRSGFTDDNQADIEEAYSILEKMLDDYKRNKKDE